MAQAVDAFRNFDEPRITNSDDNLKSSYLLKKTVSKDTMLDKMLRQFAASSNSRILYPYSAGLERAFLFQKQRKQPEAAIVKSGGSGNERRRRYENFVSSRGDDNLKASRVYVHASCMCEGIIGRSGRTSGVSIKYVKSNTRPVPWNRN